MFKPTKAKSVEEYIQSIDMARRAEIIALDKLIRQVDPRLERKLYGSIIGYGNYHYVYDSGREGDWYKIGLAAQKNYISLYICASDGKQYLPEKYKTRLPKADIGKSCVRFKNIGQVDMGILRQMIAEGARWDGSYGNS